MSTRPVVSAEPREIVGKKVSVLRRQGKLPAVVYGHGHESRSIQLDARDFDVLMRTTSRNALVDLKIGSGRATPVLLHGIHEHPVRRSPMHVDFLIVKLTETITIDVPINYTGESFASEKLGGTLLHMRESISISALPTALPSALELDISSLDSFDAVLHVSDLVVPEGVTILTDAEEPLARVQPPRVEEALVTEGVEAGAAEAAAEGAAAPEVADATDEDAG